MAAAAGKEDAGKTAQRMALQNHPELEPEFDGWDKIEDMDIPDFKRTQPEMYKRHWPEKTE